MTLKKDFYIPRDTALFMVDPSSAEPAYRILLLMCYNQHTLCINMYISASELAVLCTVP